MMSMGRNGASRAPWRPVARLVTVLLMVAALLGAMPGAAQAQAQASVTMHADSNFNGASWTIGVGTYDLDAVVAGIGNDVISSITIPDGFEVFACRDVGFGGPCFTYTSSVASLGSFNDQISSVRVTRVGEVVFEDDFESDKGWQTNPAGTDTATTGQWERANPQGTSFSGTKQRDDTTSGSNALVTGAAAGSSVGSNDIDNGVTTMQSPVINLSGFEAPALSFDYYMAHLNNSSSADFFTVSVVGDSTQVVLSEQGANNDDDGNWQRSNIDLSAFVGQSIRIVIAAADNSGASLVEAAVDTLVITGTPVEGNDPPEVTSPVDQVSLEGASVNLPVVGTDPDGDAISWSATGLPADLSIDSATGVISGTVATGAASETPYSVIVSASDGTDSTAVSFLWTVQSPSVNNPPVVTSPGDQTSTEGDSVNLAVVGSDPDGDAISWSATGLPADLSIDSATGVISGTVAAEAASGSPYAVTVTADDGTDSTAINFGWTVDTPGENQAPIPVDPGDQTSVEGDVISLQLEATDPNGDTVRFFTEELPTGLSLDNDTGIISGTLAAGAADNSPWAVFVAASDGELATLISFTWTVTAPGENQPPVVTSPGDQQSQEGDVIGLTVVGTDGDEDPLTWSATGLPGDLTIDVATGVITGTVAEGAEAASPYSVAVSASDGTDTTTVNFVWNIGAVVNQPPVVTGPGDQQSVEGDEVSLQLTASDPDGDALLYFVEVIPPGLTLGRETGLISGTIADGAADGSPYFVVVAVIDGNNPAVPISFNWTVTAPGENQAPVVTSPGDQQSDENDIVSLPIVGTDGDEDPLTWSASGLPADLSIDAATGVITGTVAAGAEAASPYSVEVSATDGTDTTTVNFVWNVGDTVNQPPFVLNPGPQVSVDGDIIEGLPLTGSDPEGEPLTWSIQGLPTGLTIDSETGVISGTIADDASASSPYFIIATASDGALSTNAVFEWIVSDGVTPNTIITGTITDANGDPFIPAEVDQYTVGPDGQRGSFILSRANVPNGTYTVFTDPGCYFMTFIAPEGQSYNGSPFFTPPSFCVEEGETEVVNAQLDPVGVSDTVIGGTVISATGGAPGVQVDLFDANADGSRGAFRDSTNTGDDGTYSFNVAAGGCFVATFVAPEGETFNGLGFFNNFGCVETGETVDDLNATFDGAVEPDTALGGVVTLGDGSPAAGVGVDLFTQAADGSRGTFLTSRPTDANGVYSFPVEAGDYVVTFISLPGETFNGNSFLSLPQTVAAGQIITDLNAAMDGEPESSIGGTVTDAAGAPAPGVGADLFEANADGSRGAYLRSDTTDADGTYVLEATEGCYVVTLIATEGETFNDSRFLSLFQCVPAGENITDVDAQFDGESGGTIFVSIGNGATPEGGPGDIRQVNLIVSLSEASTATESVTVTTSDDTATAGVDYVALETIVEFAPGETEKVVSFDVIGDDEFEQPGGIDERFDVTLSAPSAGLVIGDGAGFARIIDDDEAAGVTLSIADAAIDEADVNVPVTVTVSLSAASDADVSFDIAAADGTAVSVSDYMPISDTLTIPAGDTSIDFDVMIVGDDVEESTEEFSVSLSNPVGATIADGDATVVITDDDVAVVLPTLSIADVAVDETDADAPATLTVTMSAAADADVTVDVATADGTAVDVEDYVAATDTVTIPAGSTSATFDVVIVGDDVEEGAEEFTVSLSNPVGATIADGDATVAITDDDQVVGDGDIQISINDVTVTELNDGLRNAVMTFSIDRVFNRTIRVDFTTVDGTATVADNDYVPLTGTVSIVAGNTSNIRAVKVVGDRIIEPDETFTVVLSNPVIVSPEAGSVGVVIADGEGEITVLNND